MSWHFLQEQEEVSSEAICWDGEQFVPSSGPTTLGRYCLPDSETESCLDSQSGMMSKHSTEILGGVVSMLSQVDSLARTSVQPAKAQESTAQGLECGSTWPGSFARYDRDSSSWKIPQYSLLEGLDVFSETWPRWGMMRSGVCWVREILVPRIKGTGSGLWPTPSSNKQTASGDLVSADGSPWDGISKPHSAKTGKPVQTALLDAVRRRSTPTCRDWKSGTGAQERPGHALPLSSAIGGQLNPPWVEWLIGWPIGWTACEPLGMDKFRSWRQQHSAF